MIYVLHGSDSLSSYKRLRALHDQNKSLLSVRIDKENSSDFTAILNTQDFFATKRVISAENLLAKKLIDTKKIKESEDILILWEDVELPPASLKNLTKIATIENFKLPATLFYFLDSLTPGNIKALVLLKKLNEEKSLLWHVTNRLMLLIFAKVNMNREEIIKLTKRPIADWQWDKIKNQAQNFEASLLKRLFTSTLKIENAIKSGKTDLDTNTLLMLALTKFLAK